MKWLLAITMLLLFGATACAEEAPALAIARLPVPENAALTMVRDMKAGWNLGNTFDAHTDNPWFKDELQYESIWCGEKTTPELISAVKAAGFRTIRVPVSWHNHVDEDFTISEVWLARVEEIVRLALSEDLYVILNTHHDLGAKYYYPSKENMPTSIRYITRIWEQLAARFADCGERLLFEGMNEPRLSGTQYEWSFDITKQACYNAALYINKLNQTFVDAVRAAGGCNTSRYLMVSGYCASLDGATNRLFALPTDAQDNRLIVSVHAYTPYSFALQPPTDTGSVNKFSLENAAQTSEIERLADKLYAQYVQKGIPVIIGEYGSRDKGGNIISRTEHAAFYTACMRARGITCCWWDNNAFFGSGENFGLINRRTLDWTTSAIVDAIMKNAE